MELPLGLGRGEEVKRVASAMPAFPMECKQALEGSGDVVGSGGNGHPDHRSHPRGPPPLVSHTLPNVVELRRR
jgi:hypothetical protein